MVWDSTTIGAMFQGLAALAVALGLTAAGRSRRSAVDRGAFRTLQRECLAWADHGYTLERRLAGAGLPVPARPAILEARYGPAFSSGPGGDHGEHGDTGSPAPANA